MPDLSLSSIEYYAVEPYNTERPSEDLSSNGLEYVINEVLILVPPTIGPSSHGSRPNIL